MFFAEIFASYNLFPYLCSADVIKEKALKFSDISIIS